MSIRTEQYMYGLRDMVRQFQNLRSLVLVEIGSFEGESTSVFHESGIFKEIYCVDPYQPCSDFNAQQVENARKVFASKFQFAYNIVQVRGTVDDFVSKYINCPGSSLKVDGVYIDGSHQYDDVIHDIEMCRDVIKPSIFIAGHDYGEFSCPDVKRAVDEIFKKSPDMTFIDKSWLYWQNQSR